MAKHDYESEAELCTVFVEHARKHGWIVFPETSDWDLLLVATDQVTTFNARAGDQIGVQAKLHASVDVIAQAMPDLWGEAGPHFHAVLVPVTTPELNKIAQRCGILVMEATRRIWHGGRKAYERSVESTLQYLPPTMRQYYDKAAWHPEVEIWVPAGVRSPRRVTPWKIEAVRLSLKAVERGYLTSGDFMAAKQSMTIWRQKSWIEATGEKIGRTMKYRLVLENKPPHLEWPEIAERLREDEAQDQELSRQQQKRISAQ